MDAASSTLVALGGAAGAWCRYAAGRALPAEPGAFPLATLLVNALGSLVLGGLAVACRDRPAWYLLLGTGFCGGLTTFSTFSLEVVALLERGRWGLALGYTVASLAAGLGGAVLALKLAGR